VMILLQQKAESQGENCHTRTMIKVNIWTVKLISLLKMNVHHLPLRQSVPEIRLGKGVGPRELKNRRRGMKGRESP